MRSSWAASRRRPGRGSDVNGAPFSFAKLVSPALLAAALSGCALFARAPAPSLFTLQPELTTAVTATPPGGPAAIAIAPPVARPGLDGPRMAYVTRPYELRYFARHQWVEPPARLLAPLLVLALERGGQLRPVQAHAGVTPALRLETELVALQQEFDVSPSRLRFALRAQLVDTEAERVIASTDLETTEPAGSEDPYGGVVAANRAVARVLEQLAGWCETEVSRVAPAR